MTRDGSLPGGPDELDQAWLHSVFPASAGHRARVAEVRPVGAGAGVMSDVYRVRISGDAPDVPASVIVKLAARNPASREAARAFGSYRAECRFYNELAARLPIRTPFCHASACSADAERFMLVLEDLQALEQPASTRGASATQLALGMAALGALHRAGERKAAASGRTLAAAADVAARDFAQMLTAGLRLAGVSPSPRLERCLRRFLRAPRLPALRSPAPVTLVHADFRLDNVFFDGPQAVVIDWQDVCAGDGGFDTALWMLTTAAPAVQLGEWPASMRAYCDARGAPPGASEALWHACLAHMPNALYVPALVLVLAEQAGQPLAGPQASLRRAMQILEVHLDAMVEARPELGG